MMDESFWQGFEKSARRVPGISRKFTESAKNKIRAFLMRHNLKGHSRVGLSRTSAGKSVRFK